ncbi:MAG: porin [Bacteroidota bacterium]
MKLSSQTQKAWRAYCSNFSLALFTGLFLFGLAPKNVNAQSDSLIMSGYIDAYYQYNFHEPLSAMNGGRIFDLNHDNISLGLAQAYFEYVRGKSSAVLDLTFGPNANLGNFGNFGTGLAIKQAYFSYNFSEAVSITAGQYGTHIGYELIDAPANVNYSLSYLFGNGPFYHTGFKADIAVNDQLAFMIGVVNGWDSFTDFNQKKSVTVQIAFSEPNTGLDLYVNYIGGDEFNGQSAFGETEGSFTHLLDLTGTLSVTDNLLVGLNAAYGMFKSGMAEAVPGDPYSDDANWGGAALYLNYDVSDILGFGLRGEYFDDPSGVRYFGALTANAITLTGDIKLDDGHFMIKPELRFDKSSDPFFEDADGNLTDTQFTAGIALVYQFGKVIK